MRGSVTSLTYCPRPSVRRVRFGRGTERPIYEFGRAGAVRADGLSSPIFMRARSQEPVRPHHGAPHVRRRRTVEPEPLLGLAEIAPDDVDEIVEIDLGVRIERIDIVHADQPRRHVPL